MAVQICAQCSTRYAVGLEACPHCGSTTTSLAETASTLLPQIEVACRNSDCPADGAVRQVRMRPAATGFVQLPTGLVCATCGYSPQVVKEWQPPLYRRDDDEEDDVPKISRHGGPTDKNPGEPGVVHVDTSDEQTADEHAELEGGEESSPGSSSQTSSEKQQTSSEPNDPAAQKPARTTGSRSGKARTGSSTARSTGGGQTEPTSEAAEDK